MARLTLGDRIGAGLMRRMIPGFTPEPRHVEIIPVETPMSDGVVLKGDLLMPDDVAPGTPTVVMRTPYGRSPMFRARGPLALANRGYPVLVQSARGTFGSGGAFTPQVHEQADGIDTLRWVRSQPWFTGRLATAGESYLGYVQWAVAGRLAREEPDLAPEALSLNVTMPDFGAITWDHGAYSLRNALSWSRMMSVIESPLGIFAMIGPDPKLKRGLDTMPLAAGEAAMGKSIPWYQDWVRHEDLRDEYWTQQSHTASVADVTQPITMTTGWNDIFLPWQIATYETLVAQGRPPQLTIGPWQHASDGLVAATVENTLDLFDEVFHGIPSRRPAPVRFLLTGPDEWIDSATWPPPGTAPRELFLGEGTLGDAPGTGGTAYTYDPADPTPATGGPMLQGDGGPVDDRRHEERADVVTFTGDPLEADLDVTGTPTATIWLRSDRPSVDLFVRITEVFPDGRSMSVTDGIRRVGSPATAHTDPARTADGAWPIEIEMWPTAHRFAAGNRVRIQISSGAHPRYARNTGSGRLAADDAELHVAHQEVLHSAERPSVVRMPVWSR